MKRGASAAIGLMLCGSAAFAYIRTTVSGGASTPFLFQENPESIQLHVEDVVAPDMRNADNRPVISPTSEPLIALQAALDAWTDLPNSRIRFEPLMQTSASVDMFDETNVFVFTDTPETRSITVGALNVTRLNVERDGRILGRRISSFNPKRPARQTIRSVLDRPRGQHHRPARRRGHSPLGLALGAGKNPVIGSALYPFAELSSNQIIGKLSSDDLAFARQVYPSDDAPEDLAEISGVVTADGETAGGVMVTAIAPQRGVLVSTLSALTTAATVSGFRRRRRLDTSSMRKPWTVRCCRAISKSSTPAVFAPTFGRDSSAAIFGRPRSIYAREFPRKPTSILRWMLRR